MATRREQEQRETRRASAEGWAKEQDRGFEPTAVKLPEGKSFFKLDKAGTYVIDILEYRAGEGNPRADEGYLHFEREYHAHRVPMPNGRKSLYCCLWETFGEKCPVCEWMNSHGNSADPELVKSLRPTKRHLWNVIDLNSKDLKVQVWDTNHYNRGLGFGEQIADAILNVPKYRTFAQTEGGFTLHLTVKEQTFPGGKFYAATRIDFMPRKEDYPESILNECVCLDSCLVHTSYDDLKRVFSQEPARAAVKDEPHPEPSKSERRASAPPPSRNGGSKEEEPEEEEKEEPAAKSAPTVRKGDRVRYKKKEWDVIKVGSDGTLVLEDDDGETLHAISAEWVTVVGDEEEPAPKTKSAGTTSAGKRQAPDDDADDVDEDEPAPPKRGRK